MTFSWGTIAFIFIGYIIVYSIVNRICQCVEACALSKAFAAYLAKSGSTSSDNIIAKAVEHATKRLYKTEGKGANE